MQFPYPIYDLQVFSPILWVVFTFLMVPFIEEEILILVLHFVNIFLVGGKGRANGMGG